MGTFGCRREWFIGAASFTSAPDYWIIVDDFRGCGEHTFDFNYHFAPGVELSSLEPDEDGLVVRTEPAGLLLRLYASQPVTDGACPRPDRADRRVGVAWIWREETLV